MSTATERGSSWSSSPQRISHIGFDLSSLIIKDILFWNKLHRQMNTEQKGRGAIFARPVGIDAFEASPQDVVISHVTSPPQPQPPAGYYLHSLTRMYPSSIRPRVGQCWFASGMWTHALLVNGSVGASGVCSIGVHHITHSRLTMRNHIARTVE